MSRLVRRCAVTGLLAIVLSTCIHAEEFSQEQLDFFEKKIRPVLVDKCYECHSKESGEAEGGLLVDFRNGLLAGGESGPAVVPENVKESLIVSALEYRDGLEMPPDGQLSEEVIRDFKRWIRMGVPDSRTGELVQDPVKVESIEERAAALWSLQPVQNPTPPEVDDSSWPISPIDHFLLAEMESAGLRPVEDASPEVLLRRVSFDLVGLPPEPKHVREFLKNPSREYYIDYVDSLLNSPRFGERWARHWFDIARYGESAGNSRDVLMPYAWRYRDYVIDAINADIPYDRFVTEQIAGDLLEADSIGERTRLQVATGLLAVGSKSLNGGNTTLDMIDDQIDVIGKAVLGMTVSCARCHDHKFDPIPTADYYAMVGILKSTETLYGGSTNRPKNLKDELDVYLPLGSDAELQQADAYLKVLAQIDGLKKEQAKYEKEIKELKKELPKGWEDQEQVIASLLEQEDEENELADDQKKLWEQIQSFRTAERGVEKAQKDIEKLEAQDAPPQLEYAIGVREGKKIADSPIQIRGEKSDAGEVVRRGFLSVVPLGFEQKITEQESGRRELAAWLVDSRQPLTPRVAVNRIWMHLFGKGLVETVGNLGMAAAPPTHPELLDHLAYRFVHDLNWSRKAIIREIVLSRAYQLSASPDTHDLQVDVPNQYYWRSDRRRLEAEAIRDAMLFAAGELNTERPYASIVTQIGEGEVGRGIKDELLDQPYPYRSVYLPIIRGIIPEFLKVFDFPEPSNPQGARIATNVPSQSLFLMNSPFVLEQSVKLAEQISESTNSDRERIEQLYLRAVSRFPDDREIANAQAYVDECRTKLVETNKEMDAERFAWETLCQALFASAEFRFVE